MKKLLVALLSFSLLLAGCSGGGEKKEETPKTPAYTVIEAVKAELEKTSDLEEIVNALSANEELSYVEAGYTVSEGYLNGFDDAIVGFSNGVTFGPMIGSIPFVGYIFETEDPEALTTTLKDNANLAWNICTEADEMVAETVDNYVIFVMAPESIDE